MNRELPARTVAANTAPGAASKIKPRANAAMKSFISMFTLRQPLVAEMLS
jgi:hypothetical protein